MTDKHTRRSDPDTSREAGRAITPRLRELQRKVLSYAAERGWSGFTDIELGEHFGTQGSTYRTRRSELVALGLIVDSGGRRKHGTPRQHIVWVHRDHDRRAR